MNTRWLVILSAAVALAAILWYRDRLFPKPQASPETERAQPEIPGLLEKDLKILHFYAARAMVPPGTSVLLCYGVVNATEAEITPDVGSVRPLFNKCVPVTPSKTTTYTLTAKDAMGRSVTQSLQIEVGQPQILPENGPQQIPGPTIERFEQDTSKPAGDEGLATVCYQVQGATEVEVTPAGLPRTRALLGCFYVAPRTSTTYTLTAYGPDGKTATRSLSVSPPAR